MNQVDGDQVFIVTGQFLSADLEQKALVRRLFGDNVEYDFEIYFHWYNIIHELGHAIIAFNCKTGLNPVDEEQLVNDFAVAYWRKFGESEKVNQLFHIVDSVLHNFVIPTDQNESCIDYAKRLWGTDELHNFNNYGWFQFNCVHNSIIKRKNLEQVCSEMGVNVGTLPKDIIFNYTVDKSMPYEVLDNAMKVLHYLKINMPKNIKLVFVDDPNCHMCKIIEA